MGTLRSRKHHGGRYILHQELSFSVEEQTTLILSRMSSSLGDPISADTTLYHILAMLVVEGLYPPAG
jgi:hypothetical protein